MIIEGPESPILSKILDNSCFVSDSKCLAHVIIRFKVFYRLNIVLKLLLYVFKRIDLHSEFEL
ncbi:Hypothetical protein Nlim_1804 [Candidatus Nitrosarchaeum limnium SFB1]|uniref:Uncharacterized protein n=1 Tax=Candidatus Nitrosarchaeum limnium SFB1 TaxID=886738 RepID=F3KMQ3_9ARCH|nr:Hypothetical protein Nlim_1804 [Candidatus Nitrosarchaeum limnium SFB1]